MNIAALMQQQADQRPEGIAIIDSRGGTERKTSFATLAADASRAAALFRKQGIGKGDRVLVFQPMSYELYVTLLAIFKLGAVAMFLDPSAGRDHVDRCCEIGTPAALVAGTKAHLLRLLSPSLRRIPQKFVIGWRVPGAISMARAESCAPLREIELCAAEEPALLTFTSGSTGKPKAALRSHGFLLAQHRALERALKLVPGEVDLTTLPVFLLANLASGLTSVIPQADLRFPGRIQPAPVVDQLERNRVTRSAGSPAFYRRLLEYCEREDRRITSLRRIDSGGAPVFPSFLQRLQRIAPEAQIVSVYGSTEAEPMAHVAWGDISDGDQQEMRSGKGLLTGLPVEEVTLAILPDRFGEPLGPYSAEEFGAELLPAGEVGEIVVTGEHVLKGYLHGEGDRESKFEVDGVRWHRTGDAGLLDEQGRLWLLGRCSARILDERGLLYPFTVECAAQYIEGVRRCAMASHKGRRLLLLEADGSLQADTIPTELAWAELDEVRMLKQIPVDARHNAKIDYPRLRKMLD
jgi:acyl-CoA synthetase (AMP-forming)/AMP-acid ligase II